MLEITRRMPGATLLITLTEDELRKAYELQQQLYDEDDMRDMLAHLCMCHTTDYPDSFLNAMSTSPDFLDVAVTVYRDTYDCDRPEWDQREDVVLDALKEFWPDWIKTNDKKTKEELLNC